MSVVSLTIFAFSARAAVVEVTVGWAPAPQSSITGYEIHVGSIAGVFDQHFNVGLPSESGGVLRATVNLNDSHNNFISISAYDDMSVESPYTEALLVLAAAPPPAQNVEPTTPDGKSIKAANRSVLGLGSSVEGSKSYNGLAREFRGFKGIKKHIAYGTEYTICDLEGDGIEDLVLTNLLSRAESRRMRREPGRIMIWSRSADGNGGITETLYKVRANFLDGNKKRIVDNHISCGDLDGDGYQELIVSSGRGGHNTLQILDDITTGFANFSLPGSPNGIIHIALDILGAGGNGQLHTAAGDIDGDGADEIVITFKRPFADQILILDDAGNDFAPMQHASLDAGYLTAAEDPQSADFTGDVFPSVVDIDEDGLAEIVIVHATGSNFTYTKYDDADTNFALLP